MSVDINESDLKEIIAHIDNDNANKNNVNGKDNGDANNNNSFDKNFKIPDNNIVNDEDKTKTKIYIDEVSDNQCAVIKIDGSEYCIIFQNNSKSNSESVELIMLRRSDRDEKKYKEYSMEYDSKASDDHLELLDTHNIYSDDTPRIYYDDKYFLVTANHSLISEWIRMRQYYYGNYNYNYKQNYYLKSNDYMVLNKKSNAEEALMVANYRQDSRLVVYSLERNITVSSCK
nr:5429_t:CDS:2 [Entrophospora candida]